MSRPRVAIVGLGMAVTPHAKSWLDLADRAEVVYAFSPSAERRQAFVRRFRFPLADSLEEILTDPSVAAVAVLTPPNTHLEITRRCAEAGKHVLLEKPLEITTERAVELIETCRRADVRLGVVLQHRFRPSARKLRGILDSGKLGRIVGASVRVLNWRSQTYYDEPGRGDRSRDGGGVLLTQGIHTLDLFVSLMGQPVEVFGYADTSVVHDMETEDIVAACMRFENGAMGTLDATTAAYPGFPERITVIGERGTADVIGTSLEIRYHDGTSDGLSADDAGGGTGADPMAFPHDYHRDLIADFVNAIETGREPAIPGDEALKVHRLIDAILDSAQIGRPAAVARD